jgi:hypothetical protein
VGVRELLRRMPSNALGVDRAARTLLTRACGVLVAGRTAAEVEAAAVAEGSEVPDAMLYGSLTAAMGARTDVDPTAAAEAAAAMYRRARDAGVEMDAAAALAVLTACERAGGGERALAAAEEVVAHVAARGVEEAWRVEVAQTAFSSLLVLYAAREASNPNGNECLAVRDSLARVRAAGLLQHTDGQHDAHAWHALLGAAAAKVRSHSNLNLNAEVV